MDTLNLYYKNIEKIFHSNIVKIQYLIVFIFSRVKDFSYYISYIYWFWDEKIKKPPKIIIGGFQSIIGAFKNKPQ